MRIVHGTLAGVAALAVLAISVGAGACHHRNGGASAAAESAQANADAQANAKANPNMQDTLTGQVKVVGAAPFPTVSLVSDSGGASVELVGPATLSSVNGLRVTVAGSRAGSRFTVKRFTVVGANGVSATDGRLTADGDALALVTADGVRHPLAKPSPGLRAHIGSRVWVAGPLDSEPVAYGVIE